MSERIDNPASLATRGRLAALVLVTAGVSPPTGPRGALPVPKGTVDAPSTIPHSHGP